MKIIKKYSGHHSSMKNDDILDTKSISGIVRQAVTYNEITSYQTTCLTNRSQYFFGQIARYIWR